MPAAYGYDPSVAAQPAEPVRDETSHRFTNRLAGETSPYLL